MPMPFRFLLSLLLVSVCAAALFLVNEPPRAEKNEPPPPPRITLVGVGDILLGRQLGVEMHQKGDYSIAFQNIRETLRAADIAFGNLEGPFCEKAPYPTAGMVFRFRPDAIESLKLAGLDVVSQANNHMVDGGYACLLFSVAHLRQAGIEPVGSGANFEEAHRAAVLERYGVRFAFLGYTYAEQNDSPESTRPVVAGRNPDYVRRDVAAAKQRADVVIVSLHDGAEYTQRVARETVEFARAAIDAGAAVVLGHHPHVPQRVEQYKDGWIFYSLGNFVFQQNEPPSTREALLARLTFSGAQLERVEAVPVVIEWYAQPRLARPEEGIPILRSIGLESPLLWSAPRSEQAAVSAGKN